MWSWTKTAGVVALAVAPGCHTPTETDTASLKRGAVPASAVPEPTDVIPVTADTYVRKERAHSNQGSEHVLRVKSNGNHRSLVRIDQDVLEGVVDGGRVLRASLEFTITSNGNNWGPHGHELAVHRMLVPWKEHGATWRCADDADTSDRSCDGTPWPLERKVGADVLPWAAEPSATARIRKFQRGTIAFDVTEDVEAFLEGRIENLGWVVKKAVELLSGHVQFASRESGSPPELALAVQRGVITPSGGTITVPGFGSVTFPAGAFSEAQVVEVDTMTSSSEIHDLRESSLPAVVGHVPYVFRILTDVQPQTDVEVELEVPEQIMAELGPDRTLAMWTKFCQCNEIEYIDNYYRQEFQQLDADARVIRATLAGTTFTIMRRDDGRAEVLVAIVVIDTTPPGTAASRRTGSFRTFRDESSCVPLDRPGLQAERVGSSLPGHHVISSGDGGFAPHRGRHHKGVDYRAGTGTLVLAARSGVVDTVKTQRDDSGQEVGWGYHVRLRHDDGFVSYYTHLQHGTAAHLSRGDRVEQGQVLALSDASGSNPRTGEPVQPHLHVEYRYIEGHLVDPHECRSETPFSGIWVGWSFDNSYFFSLGPDLSFELAPIIPSSRWTLRQTDPIPDDGTTVWSDSGVVGQGTFVLEGLGVGTLALISDAQRRLFRPTDPFWRLGRKVTGFPVFGMNFEGQDPLIESTIPRLPLGRMEGDEIDAVIIQDTLSTTSTPTGPTAPDTLLFDLELFYVQAPFVYTILDVNRLVLAREVPDFAAAAQLIAAGRHARPAQRTRNPALAESSQGRRNEGGTR
jgi:murein DD-endopeptidase MepM/ murein hydrolase activator NlpD